MRVAYFDCISGVSGDMTLAALIDAGADPQVIQAGIGSLGLPDCRLVAQHVKRHGFRATHVTIEHPPEHAHRHLHHIVDMIRSSQVAAAAQDLAIRIFERLGEAEAHVHGVTIRQVHFHEVGAVDSIADIVGAAIGLTELGIEQVHCSPVPTGTGRIVIAHGPVSVPAPATAELLRGVPLAPSQIEAELTTPTGAAIVRTLAQSFGPLPAMTIESIGYGAGTRELPEQANLLRLVIGTTDSVAMATDTIAVLETHLDDCSPETIGYACERLFSAGALDCSATAIQMKKGRPGTLLTVLAPLHLRQELIEILVAETTTLGVRVRTTQRVTLAREERTWQGPDGPVRLKLVRLPDGRQRVSPEFEDCRRIALATGRPLHDIQREAVEQGSDAV